jgi:outer membrane protein, heavy metal efflux system
MHRSTTRTLCATSLLAIATGCAKPAFMHWSDSPYARPGETDTRDGRSLSSSPDSTAEDSSPDDSSAIDPGSTLGLYGAIRFAMRSHPAILEQSFNVQAAVGRETQARLYPNPALSIDGESLGADAGDGGETAFLIEQEFVTAGKLKKAKAVAETDRFSAEAFLLATEFDVATRVTSAFIAVLAADQRLASERELLTLADELLASANAQVDAGAATEPDRLRAEVVREQTAIDLHTAESDAAAARRNLAAALGIDGTLDVELEGDLLTLPEVPSRIETVARVLDSNTRIEQARLAIERAKRVHILSRAQAIPSLVASIGPRYSDPNNETTFDVGLGMEIPIFDRNQGDIAAAMAERLAAGASLGALRLELIESVSIVWSSYESARYAVDAYQTSLLPKAELTLELTREAYRAGKTDYLRLLDAQQTYVRSRIASVDALEALHQASALIDGLTQDKTPWRNANGAQNESTRQ